MSVFAIGDAVETLDDTIKGIVVGVSPKEIIIESSDGFQLHYAANELMKIDTGDTIKVTNYEVARIKSEKEIPKRKNNPAPKAKERNAPKMEVDLHINQLIKSSKGMSKHDMLNLQLETAKRQLQFAISKRIQKIVFIHGVGEGVLKEELNYLFRRHENVTYYDADYKKYGLGATEVYIHQNK
ncbi:DNA mismatch repair protein MutS [Aggregatimonas sangjinii]|uniref:DNA mismatch repair protein MutS n=1 Tax=Aggregatimonas sangjinii TaxID=2583587 RepID=A0A5B7SPF5_9FLAO|nr:Smr/MutS family protein [Aggregatimonas sangjinii]QCX00545.1 DNA mismatch repair protein MutS [Aggregatimonas sangjinii]